MSLKRKKIMQEVRRVVVKVGTSLSFDPSKGIDTVNLKRLAAEVAMLRKQGTEVVMVVSGAIGAGMSRLKLAERPRLIKEQQAVAAVGQVTLMDLLSTIFAGKGVTVGQILISRQDLESGPRYFNIRNTLETLLEMGVVPVINENDTVAVDEIKFGDNDRLAALATNLMAADLLVILTDVNGLYTQDPRKSKKARLVGVVPKITRRIETSAGGEGSIAGTGGMVTKLLAARACVKNGEHMVIANGRRKGVLTRVLGGADEGTLFLARAISKERRLRWMPYSEKRLSELVVKEAALTRLRSGQGHLYPADVLKVIGVFGAGEVVRLVDPGLRTWAKGVSRCSSRECSQVKGLANWQVEQKLGHRSHPELVSHDDIVFKSKL
ncbi:MAG: glutamate 5-kinase [candidate division FCPU426 bacterium]